MRAISELVLNKYTSHTYKLTFTIDSGTLSKGAPGTVNVGLIPDCRKILAPFRDPPTAEAPKSIADPDRR